MARNSQNRLETREVALIKAMHALDPRPTDQTILAYFTRPTRSINNARISDIREGRKHAEIAAASAEELTEFLEAWPDLDRSGLHVSGDELLIKAREAMLHAVQGFNNPRALFKSEVFIVTAVIAWTYLLHYHFKRTQVDYRHWKGGAVLLTRHGAEKHWELSHCLSAPACPLDEATKANLNFLIEIRHEIEHQMTTRIDSAISAKLQACCLNFNRVLKELFGVGYGLDKELGVALQFSGIQRDQRDLLLKDMDLPQNLLAAHVAYEDALAEELVRDPKYAYRVAYVEVSVNSKGKADQVTQFIRPESAMGQEINRVMVRVVERPKFRPAEIVRDMVAEGHVGFTMHKHMLMWKAADARNPAHGYGTYLKPNEWLWYSTWVDYVRKTLTEDAAAVAAG